MLFTNPAARGGQKKLFDTSRRRMPFHSNGADVSLRNPAAAEASLTERNIEAHLAEAIRRKKVVSASQVLAEDGSGRTFVVGGPRRAQQHAQTGVQTLEFLIVGVAQIAINIPRASQGALVPNPRRLAICATEQPGP